MKWFQIIIAEGLLHQNHPKLYSYSLKYDETPDYSKIVFLMKKALMGLELGPEGIFSRRISSIDS